MAERPNDKSSLITIVVDGLRFLSFPNVTQEQCTLPNSLRSGRTRAAEAILHAFFDRLLVRDRLPQPTQRVYVLCVHLVLTLVRQAIVVRSRSWEASRQLQNTAQHR